MKNPNGSDVPLARDILLNILATNLNLDADARSGLFKALLLMHRAKPLRVADTQQRKKITPAMKAMIFALAPDTSLSNSDIAVRVGLPACGSGRVSEVLAGLR